MRYWSTVPSKAHVYSTRKTYLGINLFLGGNAAQQTHDADIFQHWLNEEGLSFGLNYHTDSGNKIFKFGCIVVMGNFEYFHQHYPAFGCTIVTRSWCMLWGDYAKLRHAVGPGVQNLNPSPQSIPFQCGLEHSNNSQPTSSYKCNVGSGFRISITLFDHEVVASGIRDHDKAVVDWDYMVDDRTPEEKYEPDIEAIIQDRLKMIETGTF